ncbi:TM2 domain-containing protein [Ferrimonas marina]|uniref:TM2 domain-containing protein n=1 Tax=Ferrimonas marina TaxID=299255 RepID=A0A1M5Z385_9GAMM|nr:TM2 domain-containing protein [Ferrimonas marina]SHI18706.1 TM2 domain-containing protein [Ferrimonas marina]
MALSQCDQCRSALQPTLMVCPQCGAGQGLDALAGVEPKLSLRSQRRASRLGIYLGTFGVHQFYLGNRARGALYLALCWSLVPTLLGVWEGLRVSRMSPEEFYRRWCLPQQKAANIGG